ncbi:MAG TPA: hypothetical protein VI978_02830 [Candidatus Paceibacterota bacterium]
MGFKSIVLVFSEAETSAPEAENKLQKIIEKIRERMTRDDYSSNLASRTGGRKPPLDGFIDFDSNYKKKPDSR